MTSDGQSGETDDAGVPAAEFVLGLLPADEHDAMLARMATDPAFRRDVAFWRSYFAGLDGDFASVPAPSGVLGAVESRLFGARSGHRAPRFLDELAIWRALAAAAIVVAVVAVGTAIFSLRQPAIPAAPQLVAALEAPGSPARFVATYSATTGTLRLVGLSGAPVAGRDYELWYIESGKSPVSMGLVAVDRPTTIGLGDAARAAMNPGTILAVSLEPKGGSPTGQPTGPIVAKGATAAT
jgi:anti-sigma-K factor RskA